MNFRRLSPLLPALAWLAIALHPATAPDLAAAPAKAWESSLVNVEVNRREFDFLQPWSRRSQTSLRPGIVIGPREILTTADNFDDRTLLRLQKSGRGTWSEAEVKWIDYAANLALLTTTNSGFWAGLKPVAIERGTITDKPLTIARWRGGRLETRRADFNRFTASKGNQTDAMHAVMELNSEIDGTGWGEPVFAGSRLVGLVTSQAGNVLQALPSPFIHAILQAHRQGAYRGLGYFDFVWQPAENPETLHFLKLAGPPRGALVIHVPHRPGATPALKPRDLILQIDGFDIDTEGDYLDPLYGHLMLEALSTRNKWAGDTLNLKVWRDGQAVDVVYTLPKVQDAARLVPEAPFDQEPEYLIMGGLVFQPLTRNYLRSWGQDWERRAPFRLAYFRNEDPAPERPSLVVLSQILPDVYSLGYQEARTLVVEKVNGRRISRLTDLEAAFKSPVDGFHVLEFLKGDSLQRMVLDAASAPAATRRVLERYGIQEPTHILPPAS